MELFLVSCAWIAFLTVALVLIWTKLEILCNKVSSEQRYQKIVNNVNTKNYEILELMIKQIKDQYKEHEDRLNSIPGTYVIRDEPLNSEEALYNTIYMQVGMDEIDEVSEDDHYEEMEDNFQREELENNSQERLQELTSETKL